MDCTANRKALPYSAVYLLTDVAVLNYSGVRAMTRRTISLVGTRARSRGAGIKCARKFSGGFMKETTLTIPQVGLIAVTRVALGVGIGLLLSRKFDERERLGAG